MMAPQHQGPSLPPTWTALELLMLASAISRHGTNDWSLVANELISRARFVGSRLPQDYSADICEQLYSFIRTRYGKLNDTRCDLHDRVGPTMYPKRDDKYAALLDELKNESIAQIKQDQEQADLVIKGLQSRLQALKNGAYDQIRSEEDVQKEDIQKEAISPEPACVDHEESLQGKERPLERQLVPVLAQLSLPSSGFASSSDAREAEAATNLVVSPRKDNELNITKACTSEICAAPVLNSVQQSEASDLVGLVNKKVEDSTESLLNQNADASCFKNREDLLVEDNPAKTHVILSENHDSMIVCRDFVGNQDPAINKRTDERELLQPCTGLEPIYQSTGSVVSDVPLSTCTPDTDCSQFPGKDIGLLTYGASIDHHKSFEFSRPFTVTTTVVTTKSSEDGGPSSPDTPNHASAIDLSVDARKSGIDLGNCTGIDSPAFTHMFDTDHGKYSENNERSSPHMPDTDHQNHPGNTVLPFRQLCDVDNVSCPESAALPAHTSDMDCVVCPGADETLFTHLSEDSGPNKCGLELHAEGLGTVMDNQEGDSHKSSLMSDSLNVVKDETDRHVDEKELISDSGDKKSCTDWQENSKINVGFIQYGKSPCAETREDSLVVSDEQALAEKLRSGEMEQRENRGNGLSSEKVPSCCFEDVEGTTELTCVSPKRNLNVIEDKRIELVLKDIPPEEAWKGFENNAGIVDVASRKEERNSGDLLLTWVENAHLKGKEANSGPLSTSKVSEPIFRQGEIKDDGLQEKNVLEQESGHVLEMVIPGVVLSHQEGIVSNMLRETGSLGVLNITANPTAEEAGMLKEAESKEGEVNPSSFPVIQNFSDQVSHQGNGTDNNVDVKKGASSDLQLAGIKGDSQSEQDTSCTVQMENGKTGVSKDAPVQKMADEVVKIEEVLNEEGKVEMEEILSEEGKAGVLPDARATVVTKSLPDYGSGGMHNNIVIEDVAGEEVKMEEVFNEKGKVEVLPDVHAVMVTDSLPDCGSCGMHNNADVGTEDLEEQTVSLVIDRTDASSIVKEVGNVSNAVQAPLLEPQSDKEKGSDGGVSLLYGTSTLELPKSDTNVSSEKPAPPCLIVSESCQVAHTSMEKNTIEGVRSVSHDVENVSPAVFSGDNTTEKLPSVDRILGTCVAPANLMPESPSSNPMVRLACDKLRSKVLENLPDVSPQLAVNPCNSEAERELVITIPETSAIKPLCQLSSSSQRADAWGEDLEVEKFSLALNRQADKYVARSRPTQMESEDVPVLEGKTTETAGAMDLLRMAYEDSTSMTDGMHSPSLGLASVVSSPKFSKLGLGSGANEENPELKKSMSRFESSAEAFQGGDGNVRDADGFRDVDALDEKDGTGEDAKPHGLFVAEGGEAGDTMTIKGGCKEGGSASSWMKLQTAVDSEEKNLARGLEPEVNAEASEQEQVCKSDIENQEFGREKFEAAIAGDTASMQAVRDVELSDRETKADAQNEAVREADGKHVPAGCKKEAEVSPFLALVSTEELSVIEKDRKESEANGDANLQSLHLTGDTATEAQGFSGDQPALSLTLEKDDVSTRREEEEHIDCRTLQVSQEELAEKVDGHEEKAELGGSIEGLHELNEGEAIGGAEIHHCEPECDERNTTDRGEKAPAVEDKVGSELGGRDEETDGVKHVQYVRRSRRGKKQNEAGLLPGSEDNIVVSSGADDCVEENDSALAPNSKRRKCGSTQEFEAENRQLTGNQDDSASKAASLTNDYEESHRSEAGRELPDYGDSLLGREGNSRNDGTEEVSRSAHHVQGLPVNLEQVKLLEVLEKIQGHSCASFFRGRLDPEAFPNYDKVVRQHMDLSMIQTKVGDGAYNSYSQFIRDLLLVFSNGMVFFQRDSPEYNAAEMLRTFSLREIKTLLKDETEGLSIQIPNSQGKSTVRKASSGKTTPTLSPTENAELCSSWPKGFTQKIGDKSEGRRELSAQSASVATPEAVSVKREDTSRSLRKRKRVNQNVEEEVNTVKKGKRGASDGKDVKTDQQVRRTEMKDGRELAQKTGKSEVIRVNLVEKNEERTGSVSDKEESVGEMVEKNVGGNKKGQNASRKGQNGKTGEAKKQGNVVSDDGVRGRKSTKDRKRDRGDSEETFKTPLPRQPTPDRQVETTVRLKTEVTLPKPPKRPIGSGRMTSRERKKEPIQVSTNQVLAVLKEEPGARNLKENIKRGDNKGQNSELPTLGSRVNENQKTNIPSLPSEASPIPKSNSSGSRNLRNTREIVVKGLQKKPAPNAVGNSALKGIGVPLPQNNKGKTIVKSTSPKGKAQSTFEMKGAKLSQTGPSSSSLPPSLLATGTQTTVALKNVKKPQSVQSGTYRRRR